MKTSEVLNIRSITLGIDHKLLGDSDLLEKLKNFNAIAFREFEGSTDFIRTKRICSTPINNQDGSLGQDRTASLINKMQDLITNLEKEIIGYRNTLDFIEGDYEIPKDAQKAYEEYRKCF